MKNKIYAYLLEFKHASFVSEFGECAWCYHEGYKCWRIQNDNGGDDYYLEYSPTRYSDFKIVGESYVQ